MKCFVTIDKDVEEKVDIYAHEYYSLIDQIKQIVDNEQLSLIGYRDNETIPLSINKIQRFYIENSKVYCSDDQKTYLLKQRLYQIEEIVKESFVKVNQSCLVNVSYIQCFKSSWNGSLVVVLKNGEEDYVSRRQTKVVLERIKKK